MVRGLEHLFYDNMRDLRLFILEKRSSKEGLIRNLLVLKGIYKKDGDGIFIRACHVSTRGNASTHAHQKTQPCPTMKSSAAFL